MTAGKLGTYINELSEIRQERKELESQVSDLVKRYNELKALVIEELDRIGLDKASGDLASVSISETEVPTVKDWTKLMRFIKRENALYLFERRLSKSGWQELVETRKGRSLPGVESYIKRDLNLRAR